MLTNINSKYLLVKGQSLHFVGFMHEFCTLFPLHSYTWTYLVSTHISAENMHNLNVLFHHESFIRSA